MDKYTILDSNNRIINNIVCDGEPTQFLNEGQTHILSQNVSGSPQLGFIYDVDDNIFLEVPFPMISIKEDDDYPHGAQIEEGSGIVKFKFQRDLSPILTADDFTFTGGTISNFDAIAQSGSFTITTGSGAIVGDTLHLKLNQKDLTDNYGNTFPIAWGTDIKVV